MPTSGLIYVNAPQPTPGCVDSDVNLNINGRGDEISRSGRGCRSFKASSCPMHKRESVLIPLLYICTMITALINIWNVVRHYRQFHHLRLYQR